jgi:hypothetical protein
MRTSFANLSCSVLFCIASIASAQEPPAPKPTPQSEAGEPRANTSSPAADQTAPAAKPARPTAQSEAGEPRAGASKTAGRPSKPGAATGAGADGLTKAKGPGGSDRLDLGTATVTGDREQPKVMYIVPWKRSDIGDLAGKPMNSLVDEILSPVDRDVFKREVVYYNAVQSDATQNGASAHRPSEQVEK